jgi:hypothetical protein
MLIAEAFPSLATDLQQLLSKRSGSELAAQVPAQQIVDRCRCGDDFCASFYTQPKPTGRYPTEIIELDTTEGMLILEVVDRAIAHVEVLNREGVRKVLLNAIP